MAKKEMRRAARQAQRDRQIAKRERRPSWRRSIITAVLLAVLWLGISRLLAQGTRPIQTDLLWAGIFFVFYTLFVYYWETFLYRRRLRRQAGKK